MTNADIFRGIFGIYASQLWSKSYKEFLDWLNKEVPDTNVGDIISRQAAIANYQRVCATVKCGDCPFRIVDGAATDCRLEKFLHELPPAQREGKWIDVDALCEKMYHEAFEIDSDEQRWDSGCWIRYKMFERVVNSMPAVVISDREDE